MTVSTVIISDVTVYAPTVHDLAVHDLAVHDLAVHDMAVHDLAVHGVTVFGLTVYAGLTADTHLGVVSVDVLPGNFGGAASRLPTVVSGIGREPLPTGHTTSSDTDRASRTRPTRGGTIQNR
ncbi:MAG: hypothetical protein IRZ07_08275 [Microbispora sp.]|nr:hypothetical protein [Microbispora sp.]